MEELNNQKSSMVEIFVNLLSFILLGIVATSVGIVFFQAINRYFPDILSFAYNNYEISGDSDSAIRYAIASLFIGFPLYALAVWFWFRGFQPSIGGLMKLESKISKWLTYIILFIASGTIIGDMIAVVFNFLQGEYSVRFLLKAFTILVISGMVFGFYFFERKRIQYKKEVSSGLFKAFAASALILVVLAIALGFAVVGSPAVAKQRNLDIQKTQDLEQVYSCVSAFAFDNRRLPQSLSELKNNARYNYCFGVASDRQAGKEYEYRAVSENQFELCAVFNLSTMEQYKNARSYSVWQKHDSGRVCNTQSVTFNNPSNSPADIPVK